MAGNRHTDIELFAEAVQLPNEERIAFLDRACAGDEDLHQRIEALLRSNDRAGNFMEEPPTSLIGEGRAKAAAGEQPGDRVGRYKLLQQIGEGGCGVVFVAEQEEPIRRRVALKVIKPGMDTKSVIARFEAERQALALMDHPNIAHVFDAGATGSGRPYFVMELVDGVKITDYCDQHSLPVSVRLDLFVQVCDAIQHAHQKGIIHRDIKPSNILVTTGPDGKPVPKVIDFGIAKATTSQQLTDKTILTSWGMLIGTPAYMSPEQATLASAELDTRTDIYSLGVLLYELLTGTTPFDTRELLKAGLDEVRRVVREVAPVRPSTRLSGTRRADLTEVCQHRLAEPSALIRQLRGDLDWIVMMALEKDRTRRYKTANALALDIQRFLGGETVSARPPSKLYRFQKLVLRNKLLFTGIGIIAGLLVVSLIVVSAALAKERRSRREAEAASVKSREVTKFLETMLNGVGPSVSRGRDTAMLQEILDETAERVGKAMTNQPEVEAELRNIIASLYAEIGHAPKGEKMVHRALAIRREKSGADSLEAAESLNLLGMLLMVQHKVPEAERAHSEALAIRRRRLGDENADTATSLDALAEVYRDQRKLSEAEAMAREGLRIRKKLFGNEYLETANSLRNLCMIQGYRERWAEAEQTAREVLAIRRKLLGDDDHRVAFAMEDLSWILSALKKFEEAQSLHLKALVRLQSLLGDAHPDISRNLASQGQLLKNRGDLEGSEGVLKATLAIQRKLMGDDSQAIASTLCSLARTLHERRKLSEAESAWREALAILCKRLPPDHPERVHAERGLGEILEAEGKWSEAEQLWRESLSFWRQRGGIEEKESMYVLRRLGVNLECVRKWPEAETVFQEALAISQKRGNEDPEVLVDLDRVVRSLLAQGKLAAAQQHLDRVLTPTFILKPASAGLLVLRVNVMGRRGRWREAAADAARALEHQLTDHYRYHTLAALLAKAGDRPAYEQVCKRFVTKFADATDPYVAERIAQDCFLLPNSGADLGLMDKLADKAVTAGSSTDGLPYFQACKAMSLYRLGNYSESIDWGNKAAKSSTGFAQAKACGILAMAHWQLGQRNEAIAALGRGDALAPALSTETGVDDLGESWLAWLMARISLDESVKLINAKSISKEDPNSP